MRDYPTLHTDAKKTQNKQIKEQFYIYQSQYNVVVVLKLTGHRNKCTF